MKANHTKYILLWVCCLYSLLTTAQNISHTLSVEGNAFASVPVISAAGMDLYLDFVDPDLRIVVGGVIAYSIDNGGMHFILDSSVINTPHISFIPHNTTDCHCLIPHYQAFFSSTAYGPYVLDGYYNGLGIGFGDDTVHMSSVIIHYECPPVTELAVSGIVPVTPQAAGRADVTVVASGLPYNLNVFPSPGYVFSNQSTLNTYAYQGQEGYHTAYLFDRFGCQQALQFYIPRCTIEVATEIPVPNCDGTPSGALSVIPVNAYGPYSYAWSGPSNPGNSPTINQPLPGTYRLTVTDAIGCTETKTMVIASKAPLDLTCQAISGVSRVGASDGQAGIQFSGGASPYRLYWSGLQNGSKTLNQTGSASITNLPAGDYDLLLVDQDGCQQSCTLTIPDVPCTLSWANLQITGPSCPGGQDGSLHVLTSGGQGEVLWALTNGSNRWNKPPYTGLSPGSYRLTASDALGCSLDTSFLIQDPPALQLSCSLYFPVNFFEGDNGVIALRLSGGTAPYRVDYTSGLHQGSQSVIAEGEQLIGGLTAGDYILVVTDARGCITQCATSVPPFECTMQINAGLTQPDCHQPYGQVTITTSQALDPVNYFWNGPVDPGNVSQSFDLLPGSYRIIATDFRGCRDTIGVEIQPPDLLEVTCQVLQDETGWQQNNGAVRLTWQGRDEPVQVVLYGADTLRWETSLDSVPIQGLSPGNYQVIVSQADSCSASCIFEIKPYRCATTFSLESHPTSCAEATDGQIDVLIQTGLVYTLALDDSLVYSLDAPFTLTGLLSGPHKVTLSTPDGCSSTQVIQVARPEPLTYQVVVIPATDTSLADGAIHLTVQGGTPPYAVYWSDQDTGLIREGLRSGMWPFIVEDGNHCTTHDEVVVPSETEKCAGLRLQVELFEASCPQAADGSILLTPLNGPGPYGITWEDGGNGLFRQNLPAGTYTYALTDALGCTYQDQVLVGFSQDSLQAVLYADLCPGTAFQWEGQQIAGPGNYYHHTSNRWGCDSLTQLVVSVIDIPVPAGFEVVQPSSCQVQDGNIRINYTGDYPGYFMLNQQQNHFLEPDFPNLGVGTYSIAYREGECVALLADSLNLTAPEPSWVVVVDTIYRPLCGKPASGAMRIHLEGVSSDAVTVTWSTGQKGLWADFLDPGIYSIRIAGPYCFQNHEVAIPEPESTGPVIEPKAYTICSGEQVKLQLDTSWQYSWRGPGSFMAESPAIVLGMPGVYYLTATREGCETVDSIHVNALDQYFEASFLIPQQVIAGQPFIAVENSWPVPDSIRWEYDGAAEKQAQNLNQLSLLISQPDTILVRLVAWKGACSVTVEKQVVAYTDTAGFDVPVIIPQKEILTVRMMPNPNQGVFRVHVELNEAIPSQLRIYDPQGALVSSRDVGPVHEYEEFFELNQLNPGLYTLAVQTAADWKTLPFIILQ
ncbi:MAG: T9SS type A sorting domain-containing protein [Saprospiraceae bacterium]